MSPGMTAGIASGMTALRVTRGAALLVAWLWAALGYGLVSALGWTGCAGAHEVVPLADSVRIYNDGVRWQRFEMAAEFLPPQERDGFLDRRDQLHEDLRIDDYEIVRMRHDSTGRSARVHVKLTWHLDSRGVVHETHTVQRWERRGKRWIVTAEHFLRGEPMPGVESLPEKDGASSGEDVPEGSGTDLPKNSMQDQPGNPAGTLRSTGD